MPLTISKLGNRTGDSLCPESLNEIILLHFAKQHMLVTVIQLRNNLVDIFTWTAIAINMAKWEYDPKNISSDYTSWS